MLELISPKKIQKSPYRKKLAEADVFGGWNYSLDHAWLYEKIEKYVKKNRNKLPVILDVGCGNSMFHTFIEEDLKVGVIGIDRIFGKCPYNKRDRRMDLCIDFRENTFFKNNVDIVYWCSSIEHNTVEEMKKCVKASLKALKPGGFFLATFGYAKKTHYYELSEQTNLSREDAEKVFETKWKSQPDFDKIVSEYKENIFNIHNRHYDRYGTKEYAFVVAGAELIKK